MSPDRDSIHDEPHFQNRFYASEQPEQPLRALSDEEKAAHSVWDEPGLSQPLAGETPQDAATYARWLDERLRRVTPATSWATTILTALVAGPLAIIGTLVSGQNAGAAAFGVLGAVLLAPLLEEIMKNASALWVVESRPYLFRSRWQIALCVLASGAVFAIVENLLYLHVYIDDPSPELVRWRWTVCVALHMGCALIAGLGTMRIWRHSVTRLAPPRLSIGAPYLLAAMILHGAYNAAATIMELVANPF
jgi:RsiW-degrading membrane proteinase PrsW (M82 family)